MRRSQSGWLRGAVPVLALVAASIACASVTDAPRAIVPTEPPPAQTATAQAAQTQTFVAPFATVFALQTELVPTLTAANATLFAFDTALAPTEAAEITQDAADALTNAPTWTARAKTTTVEAQTQAILNLTASPTLPPIFTTMTADARYFETLAAVYATETAGAPGTQTAVASITPGALPIGNTIGNGNTGNGTGNGGQANPVPGVAAPNPVLNVPTPEPSATEPITVPVGGPYVVKQIETLGGETISGFVCSLTAPFAVNAATSKAAWVFGFVPRDASHGQVTYAYSIPSAGEAHNATGTYTISPPAEDGTLVLSMTVSDHVTFHGFDGNIPLSYKFDLVPTAGVTCP